MRRAAALLLVLVACSTASDECVGEDCPAPERVTITLTSGGARVEISAEIADTPEARTRGLRGRASLPADEGMLFLFDDERARTFTMEDVPIPLDLLMIRGGRVVEIIEMVPCNGTGHACLYATTTADAALELAGGTAAAARIEVGAVVDAGGLI